MPVPGIEQINEAIVQMDRVTQGNASGAEENAAAAEELNAQAVTLKACVNDLLRIVNGQDAVPVTPVLAWVASSASTSLSL